MSKIRTTILCRLIRKKLILNRICIVFEIIMIRRTIYESFVVSLQRYLINSCYLKQNIN